MKKILSLFIVLVSVLGFVSAQTNVDPMNLPKLTQWVTDFSHVLTTSQLDELNATAKSYQDETSNQIVAVVFPTTNDNVLQDIGMKIFTDNAIGQKDTNNGLLLSIVTDEKKIRINVGYGLEGVYPDLMASQVIENDIRPLVNSGNIAGAIKVFYQRSEEILSGEIPAGYQTQSVSNDNGKSVYIAVIIGFLGGLLIRRFFWSRYKKLHKSTKKIIGIGSSIFTFLVFIVGIYFLGQFLLFLFLGIIFGLVGRLPGARGGFGAGFGGGFGGGGFGGGGFGGGGGFSGGGGAGD